MHLGWGKILSAFTLLLFVTNLPKVYAHEDKDYFLWLISII